MTYQNWQLPHDRSVIPPPGRVFYLEGEDDHMEAWEKLFTFASYCRTWSEELQEWRWYPILDEGWSYLRELLYYMLYEPQLVVLKVRQILFTWSLAVLFNWTCMSKPNQLCGFASKGAAEGTEFLRNRCGPLWWRLPEEWREYAPARKQHHGEITKSAEMEWYNQSRIKTFSSTGEGPRMHVFTRAAIDEANYLERCRAMMTSFRPGLGNERPLTVGSTPQVVESDFEQVVEDARNGVAGKILQFPVTCRPGRDEKWQQEMRAVLGDRYETEFGLQFSLRESHALFPRFATATHLASESDLAELYEESGYSLLYGMGRPREFACPAFCALDTHVTKPNAALWMLVLPDETWYFYDELWERCDAATFAHLVQAREQRYRVVDRVIDPSANMEHRTGGMRPVSVQLREAGLTSLRSAERHKIGIDHLQARMEPGRNNRPGLYVHPRCQMLIKQLRTVGLSSEQKAMAGGKFDFIDCAKYIANCRPQFRTWRHEEEKKEPRGSYVQLLRDIEDNMAAARRGYGGGYQCRKALH